MIINPENFIKYRESRLMSKGDLALACDLSWQTITVIEHGRPVTPRTIRRVLKGLNLSVDDAYRLGILDDPQPEKE